MRPSLRSRSVYLTRHTALVIHIYYGDITLIVFIYVVIYVFMNFIGTNNTNRSFVDIFTNNFLTLYIICVYVVETQSTMVCSGLSLFSWSTSIQIFFNKYLVVEFKRSSHTCSLLSIVSIVTSILCISPIFLL
uniref:Uncharacterized protein n=1 Tax=Cacopsylla melanoneura TaxID=428564 RepID=A0A8D8YZ75_9HEMI